MPPQFSHCLLSQWQTTTTCQQLTQNRRELGLFLIGLLTAVESVDTQDSISVCQDPKDNMFLELAIYGGAKAIVSGDRDLLVLSPFNNIIIMTVKQFLDQS